MRSPNPSIPDRPPVTSVCGLYKATEAAFEQLRQAGLMLENGDAASAAAIAADVRTGLEADLASFGRSSPDDVAASGSLGPYLIETTVRELTLAGLATLSDGESPTRAFASGLAQTEAALALARNELHRLQATSEFCMA
jgi:hypothetical protein